MSITPKRVDPRVVRTRQLLRDALIELVQQQEFDAISVKDITDHATLNKATFYLHYRDKEDLIVRSTFEVLAELDAVIGVPQLTAEEITAEVLLQFLTIFFRHFVQHGDFYRVIFNRVSMPSVLFAIQHPIEQIILRWLTQLRAGQAQPLVDQNILIQFVCGGCIGCLRSWLNQQHPAGPDYMAQQFLNLVVFGIFRSAGLPTPSMR